jgi:solute carrier family 29 (equilibrative nucleoside transporter), member 1/2/3
MNEAEGLLADGRYQNEPVLNRRQSESVEHELHLESEPRQETESLDLLVYLTFALVGASYLWPWNCFLSATPYFFSRLGDYRLLKNNAPSSIMFINTFASFFFAGYLASKQKNADYRYRVLLGELIIAFAFLVLALLCVIPFGPILYFISLMSMVFVSSLGAALTQTGSFSLVSKRGSKYTQAIMVGQAVSGVLPAFLAMLSGGRARDGSPSTILSGLYFLSATTVSGVTLVLFLMWLEKVKKEDNLKVSPNSGDQESSNDGLSSGPEITNEVPFRLLFEKLLIPSVSVALTFTVTLIYPIFANTVTSKQGLAPDVFIPLAIFIWNLGDLSGRVICGLQKLVVVRRDTMISYAVLRLLYIPLFLLCHSGAISNDVIYLLLQYSFGVTNGHLASSAMMSPVHYVQESQLEAAGGFMTVALTAGLTAGSVLSFAVVAMVN